MGNVAMKCGTGLRASELHVRKIIVELRFENGPSFHRNPKDLGAMSLTVLEKAFSRQLGIRQAFSTFLNRMLANLPVGLVP